MVVKNHKGTAEERNVAKRCLDSRNVTFPEILYQLYLPSTTSFFDITCPSAHSLY
jgi:hypothetical protein